MPSSTFWGMMHLNAHVLCSVVVDRYNLAGDPAEICILPLNHMLKPHNEMLLFNMRIKPDAQTEVDYKVCRHTRADVANLMLNGFDKYQVGDMLYEWFKNLELRYQKRIMPLGFRYHEIYPILRELLGTSAYEEMFHGNYRDLQVAVNYLNDVADCRNDPVPYSKQDLRWICKKCGFPPLEHGGSCALDALQISQAYAEILKV